MYPPRTNALWIKHLRHNEGQRKDEERLNHELSERQKTQMALMLTLEHQQKLAEIAARMEGSPGKIPPDYMRLQKSLEQEANKTTNK